MAKGSADDFLRRGERLLAEWGLAEAAGDEAAVAALSAVLGRDPAADAAVVERLGAIAHPDSLQALRSMDVPGADKRVHKQVRRALYRLERRGLVAEAPAAAAPVAFATAPAIEGYLSIVDGNGDQLVWLVRPRAGVLFHLYAVLNDPEGLREVDLVPTTRKTLRAAMQDLAAQHDLHMVQADWRYCDFVVDRALDWARARQGHVSGDYRALRARLTDEPVQATEPPVFRLLDAADVRADGDCLADSAQLLEEPEFRTWVPAPETLQPYYDELRHVEDSQIVLPPQQKEERRRLVVERAVEEIFGGAIQASWVRRLQAMAFVLHSRDRAPAARRALAAALALESNSHGGRGIPFFEALLRGALAAYARMADAQAEEEAGSHLVVTPQEALREMQRRR